MRWLKALVLTTLAFTGGCQNQPSTTEMLNSSAGVERMRAVSRLAAENRWSNIPTFIRFLEDNDVSVRWAAIQALAAQVGTDRGFRGDDPPESRAEAVTRWKEWWQTEGSRGAQTHTPRTSS